MLRFLADEDFNGAIVRSVLRLRPDIDIIRVQDVGLRTLDDVVVLNWAARAGRIILTHDAQTMPAEAYERVLKSLPLPGVFVIKQEEAISRMTSEIILLAECSLEGEWER